MSPSSAQAKPIAIAVVHRDGCVLVGIRANDIVLAGKAEFPGGKVLPDESPEQAAVRECWEETGVATRVLRLRRRIQFEYPHGTLDLHFFDCAPAQLDVKPQNGFGWLPIA